LFVKQSPQTRARGQQTGVFAHTYLVYKRFDKCKRQLQHCDEVMGWRTLLVIKSSITVSLAYPADEQYNEDAHTTVFDSLN
jgi:hypothetical protein